MSEAALNGIARQAAALGFVNLRGDASDAAFAAAAARSAGIALPQTPCTFTASGARTAYWLGPDEWLIAMPAGEETAVEGQLREGLAGLRFAATDVTGACVGFDLAGAHARETLQKASPCDFHPRAFPPGRCLQTTFAKASALIAAHAEESFRVLVRTSYADYARRWLADATAEHERRG